MDGTRHYQNVGTRSAQAFDLFPRGVADAVSADLVRKTVENSQDVLLLGEG